MRAEPTVPLRSLQKLHDFPQLPLGLVLSSHVGKRRLRLRLDIDARTAAPDAHDASHVAEATAHPLAQKQPGNPEDSERRKPGERTRQPTRWRRSGKCDSCVAE